jgi:hypothetical protein
MISTGPLRSSMLARLPNGTIRPASLRIGSWVSVSICLR